MLLCGVCVHLSWRVKVDDDVNFVVIKIFRVISVARRLGLDSLQTDIVDRTGRVPLTQRRSDTSARDCV